MKLLLYCTKAKPYIMKYKDGKYKEIASFYTKQDLAIYNLLNGKIVAECDFEVEEIRRVDELWDYGFYILKYETKTLHHNKLMQKSCLNCFEFDDYLQGKNGYAIHIKNLHIFDEPKELSKYKYHKDNHECYFSLGNAPQNMMYCYEWNGTYYEKKILISIHPEWLCKILNGEKTVEVRKNILKEVDDDEL